MAADANARHIFAENLKKYLAASGKTQNDLVDYLGCSASTVSEWLAEKKYPRPGRMQKTADFFGVLMSDMLKESGTQPSRARRVIPLVGNIACGTPILAEQNVEQMIELPEGSKQCDFALRCRGDSMVEAGICDGDIAYIRKQPQVENGEIAAVRIGDEATLKKVYFDGSQLALYAANRDSFPLPQTYSGERLADVHIEGKLVGYTHWD